MGILGRLLLLYVLAVMVALAASAGVCLHLISTQVWQNELQWIISRQETLIVLAVMFLASLCLLMMALSSKKKPDVSSNEIQLHKGTENEIVITSQAIISIVDKAARSVEGVRQVDTQVFGQPGDVPMNIKMSLILGQNYSAPNVSAQVKSAVNEALNKVLQVSNIPVEVKVTEVTHAALEREKRVV